MTVTQASHEAYKLYTQLEPKGREQAAAKACEMVKRLLAQPQAEPDAADFNELEQEMFLQGTRGM